MVLHAVDKYLMCIVAKRMNFNFNCIMFAWTETEFPVQEILIHIKTNSLCACILCIKLIQIQRITVILAVITVIDTVITIILLP